MAAPSVILAPSQADQAWESYVAQSRFGSLDGLRCLSILAVLWHHGPGFGIPGLLGRGYFGVPLFFAISGFLITTLLLRERRHTGTISLRRFYARRTLRIFPLYYAVLGVYVILAFTVIPSDDAARFFDNLPYFLTYTFNWRGDELVTFGFAWSLAAEEQFYSTWPFVMGRLSMAVSAAAMSCLFAFALWYGHVIQLPIAISGGSLLALALHSRRGFGVLWRLLGSRWMPWLTAGAALAVLHTGSGRVRLAHVLLVLLVGTCVIREDHGLARLLRLRGLVYIGTISYGMYLLHGLIYAGLARFGWPTHSIPGFLIVTCLTIAIATVSFRYFESPFLRWKERFEVARG